VILDLRIYAAHPGRLGRAVDHYGQHTLPLQRRHLGEIAGAFQVDSGRLNRMVLLWEYPSMAERERRRAALNADPDWAANRERVAELRVIQAQENGLLQPLPFSPWK
jgi:hypothetical protein